jgi:hypothetical protein
MNAQITPTVSKQRKITRNGLTRIHLFLSYDVVMTIRDLAHKQESSFSGYIDEVLKAHMAGLPRRDILRINSHRAEKGQK